jgi:HEPN domain-containing protein
MNAPHLEARRWFQEAQADLAVVRTLQGVGHHAAACFHSQQAAEKALKALLYAQGARVVLGPSVRDLARQCEGHDPAFAKVADDTALLDQFYITMRYPNGLPAPAVPSLPAPAVPSESFTNSQSQAAQEAAERVIRLVETFVRTHTDVLE